MIRWLDRCARLGMVAVVDSVQSAQQRYAHILFSP